MYHAARSSLLSAELSAEAARRSRCCLPDYRTRSIEVATWVPNLHLVGPNARHVPASGPGFSLFAFVKRKDLTVRRKAIAVVARLQKNVTIISMIADRP